MAVLNDPIRESDRGSKPPMLGVPKRDLATSAMGWGPIPWRWLPVVLALVAEQMRVAVWRPSERRTHMETLAVSWGIRSAERIRDKGAVELTKLAVQVRELGAKVAAAKAASHALDEKPVVSVHGGLLTVTETEQRAAAVQSAVTAEADDGSLKHQRVPTWLRRVVPWATLLDLPMMLYFIGQVLNVDFAGLTTGGSDSLAQSIVPLVTAASFAIFGTIVVAVGLHFFAQDLRNYKNDMGHPDLPAGRSGLFPAVYLGLSVVVAISAGILVSYRIISDGFDSGSGTASALILGLFFTVAVFMLNVVIFSAHYRDGSNDTNELDHLTGQLQRIQDQKASLRERIEQLNIEQAELREGAARLYDKIRSDMSEPLCAADQVLLLARSYHQGCDWEATLGAPVTGSPHGLIHPFPLVDTSVLEKLFDQLRTDAPLSPTHPIRSTDSKLPKQLTAGKSGVRA